MDTSSRPRSTKTTVRGVKVAQVPLGLTFTVARGGTLRSLPNTVLTPTSISPAGLQALVASLMGTSSFAKTTSMAGHAGVCVNSQLTLRVDYLMKANQHRGEDRYWDSSS